MGRPRIHHEGTTASERVAASTAALLNSGGARKTYRLSREANEALKNLMLLPNAPDTETALIESLLISESKRSAKAIKLHLLDANHARKKMRSVRIPKTGVGNYVKFLANEYGIAYVKTHADAFADTVTRLAGDDVVTDEIEDLMVSLKRSGIVTGREMMSLLAGYLKEKHGI